MSPSTLLKASNMRSLIVFVVCLAFFISASPIALAAGASIKLSPTSGPPTSKVTVSGTGFGASEKVTITFDTTSVGAATTSSSGTFSQNITVPKSALPGNHTVKATGQTSKLTASATFLVRTNWSMYGFDLLHTHLNPYENVLSPSNVSKLQLDWSFTTGAFIHSSPAVVNGVVYVGSDDQNVYALNSTTGAKKWSFHAGGGIDFSSPAVANGVVYIGSGDHNVYALNATTGVELWSFTTGNEVRSSPTVANGVVYVGSDDQDVYALDAKTGLKKWSFATGGGVLDAPAVAHGVVYIGCGAGTVYALNATTGALLWRFSTGFTNFNSSPAVANGVVYIGSGDHNVYALNATTGAKLWSFTTGSFVFSS